MSDKRKRDDRKTFEAWASTGAGGDRDLTRRGENYANPETETAWNDWQVGRQNARRRKAKA